MQLSPGEQYAIVRKLYDHTDSGTYYVRAFVRDARTDELLATINLTDRGDRRFGVDYQIPGDSVGLGRYITIETSVYSDSGYTTKSTNYSDEIHTLLINERKAKFGGGGGGVDVDYEKIGKIINKAISDNKIDIPENDINGPLAKLQQSVIKAITDNKVDPTPPADFTPVLVAIQNAMDSVVSAVEEKEIPKPEKIDYEKLEKAANKTLDNQKTVLTKITSAFKGLEDAVKKYHEDVAQKIESIPPPAMVIDSEGRFAIAKPPEKKEEEKPPERVKFKGLNI